MSEILFGLVANTWGDWEALVKASGVNFSKRAHSLGDKLFKVNPWPEEREMMLHVTHGGFTTTLVSSLVEKPCMDYRPVHPAFLLTVAAGMRWNKNWWSRASQMFEYRQFVSPFLLSLEGKNYILTIERDDNGDRSKNRLLGDFQDLSSDDHLPRCMHIYESLRPYDVRRFREKNEDGVYKQSLTWKD